MPIRIVDDLSDEELESCFDGSSSVDLVREICEKSSVIGEDGYLVVEEFGQWFAYGAEGFIDAEADTEEWQEAYDNNEEWGQSIAENINAALDIEEPEEYQ